ncbi:UPF0182 family protein [Streptacidiphilus cavernicola]|uniref:UPF0182 family protein n=1 Tax=Streptacidiphilus cavernicola TaxID=3342716 RepID=A0ABV6VUA4_9ACTN
MRTALVAVLLAGLFATATAVWADRLWYDSVGYGGVWSTVLSTRALLFLAFGLATSLLVGVNCWLAYRLRAPLSAMSEEQRSLERYRWAVDRHRGRVLALAALVPGLVAGAAASDDWRTWLAYDHGTRFGTVDPQFHRDLSFYVFTLPWYRCLLGFGLTVLVATLAITALVHYLYGSIQAQARGRRFSGAAQAHLGVLLGLFTALKAVAYWLDRYALELKDGSLGPVRGWTGLDFTDATAGLPGRAILCCAALICAVLFLLTPLRRSWTVPMIGLGLMALSSVLVGTVYPALVQQFQVRADQKAKEQPYLQRNITATRDAFGIAAAGVTAYPAAGASGTGNGGGTTGGDGTTGGAGSAAAPHSDAAKASGSARVPSAASATAALGGLRLPAPAAAAPAPADAPGARVLAVAPWLSVDGDPYPVTVGGRKEWVVDGYTTSDDYPYAARATLGSGGSGVRVNYVRDAVKATVDAKTGAVTLYQWDRTDPVLSTWMKAFPGTVRPYAEIGADLKSELRYPEDLFTTQQRMLADYHVTDAASFYDGGDAWQVPADPAGGGGAQPPAYLSLPEPGRPTDSTALTGAFVTGSGKKELAALISADPHGTLRVLDLAPGTSTPGPAAAQAAFGADPLVGTQLALLRGSSGSSLSYGGLVALPVGGGVLYTEAVYLGRPTGARPVPEKVLAMFGSRTAIASDLPTALSEVLVGAGSGSSGLDASLSAARQAYQDGVADLGRGDTAAYRADRERLAAALGAALGAVPAN